MGKKKPHDYGSGRCPKCRHIYDTSVSKSSKCPKCKVGLKGIRRD